MPSKFSIQNIRKSINKPEKVLSFEIPEKDIYDKMSTSLASSASPGFSYLLLFKEEYHEEISANLGPSPTIKVVLCCFKINKETRTPSWIKPSRFDDSKTFSIESGRVPPEPTRHEGWAQNEEEPIEDFNERIYQYQLERQRWFEAKDFLYRVGIMYQDYKFV
ncbi:MAG TPA: hypothetical protein VIY08_12645 [Candidatus Nitrosocosmicus sp.]